MRHKVLFYLYLMVALVAAVFTIYCLSFYFNPHVGFVSAYITGTKLITIDTFVNKASSALVVDLAALFIVLAPWMYFDAKELKIKGVFIYIILLWFGSFGVFFSLYMAVREYKLHQLRET